MAPTHAIGQNAAILWIRPEGLITKNMSISGNFEHLRPPAAPGAMRLRDGTPISSVEIARPNCHPDEVHDQPARSDAGDLVHIRLRCDLDHVHADHAALSHQAMNELSR